MARYVGGAAVRSNGAYIDPDLIVPPNSEGSLSGLTFSVKDIFDVQGQLTGFGNPTWRQTHSPPAQHAPVVAACLAAGATLKGKVHMDEMAYSLNGRNQHYGTPVNPAAPDRIPGGSSSGSAVSVAAGDVDFSLGSDTAGSVRIPASFNGIFGMRPTHGRLSLSGACSMAASCDTAGWFARTSNVLQTVGKVLLQGSPSTPATYKRWLVAKNFYEAHPEVSQGTYTTMSPCIQQLIELLGGPPEEVDLLERLEWEGGFTGLLETLRLIQAHEIWAEHKDWIATHNPAFGAGIKERLEAAAKVTDEEAEAARATRARLQSSLDSLLGSDALLMLPTAPGPAPLLTSSEAELNEWRQNVISLTCIATLGGLPQVNIPVGRIEGGPIGLGLISPRGSDESLLEVTAATSSAMGLADGLPPAP